MDSVTFDSFMALGYQNVLTKQKRQKKSSLALK